ncbi:MAG: hypothetical protein HZB51_20925 [Chloroflexi bacterium]|nr:hypothetical protein [Chloroflexota bacterium]
MSVRQDKTPWIIIAVLVGVIFCMVVGILGALASWWWNQNQTKARVTATSANDTNLILPTPMPTLLPIPSIAQEFDRWQMWLQPGSRVAGNNLVQVIGDTRYKQVVQFTRTNGQGDGGAAGLILPVDLNVASYPHVHVQLIGKIEKEMGGNIANTKLNMYPEGAAQVRIKYQTANAQAREWFHGFYTGAIIGVDESHFTQVLEKQWFTFVSFDLKALPEPPQKIQEIRVYGFGWEFQSAVAQFSLLGSTELLPSTDPTPSSARRPKVTNQDLPKDKAICEAQGGKWGKIGLSPTEQCNLPTPDAGKVCSDSSDCAGMCIANLSQTDYDRVWKDKTVIQTNGKCTPWRITVGCVPQVTNGKVQGILCID